MKEGPISSSSNFNHVPIMGKEIIQSLKELPSELTKQGLIIDATIGGGGHSAQILENFPCFFALNGKKYIAGILFSAALANLAAL